MTNLSISDSQPGGSKPLAQDPHPVEYSIHPKGDTAAEQAEDAIRQCNSRLLEHAQYVAGVQHLYSSEGLREQVAAFENTEAAKTVDHYTHRVDQRAEQAEQRVKDLEAALIQPGDGATESRNQRSWDRQRRILDAAPSGEIFKAATELLTTVPAAQLGTLLEELPDYLKARGTQSDWLESAVAERIPQLASAREDLRVARQAQVIIRHSAATLKKAIKNGRPAVALPSTVGYDPDRRA